MKTVSQAKQLVINMSACFVSYGISLFISFFLSPYIVKTIGVEANGFVGLANNFVSYASIITIALNSLAGRFITINLTRGDKESANRYFTSVFFANLVIALFLAVIGGGIIVFLDRIINVPPALLSDVRWLFTFVFLNCILSVVGSVFSVATFARNRLYLSSLREIEANLARALCIIGLFALTTPRVCYLGAASLLSGSYTLVCNMRYTKLLLPEVRIHQKHFHFRAVCELISSGIWNTINRLGQILMDGLDLLITNLMIDATSMGVLSLAKMVPSLITGLMGTVVGVFSPNFTILYAENRHEDLLTMVRQAMKIMGLLTNLPIIVLIVCGQDFFSLWQPTQNPRALQILGLLSIGVLIFSGGINCLYNIFTVVNKIRLNSLVVLATSFFGTICTLILLKTTSLGIYAVAGTSTAVALLRNLLFTAPYGAHCLNLKWYTFYPDIFRPAAYTVFSSIVCMALFRFSAQTWLPLFGKAAAVCIISGVIGFFLILNQSDRKYLTGAIKQRLHTQQ